MWVLGLTVTATNCKTSSWLFDPFETHPLIIIETWAVAVVIEDL